MNYLVFLTDNQLFSPKEKKNEEESAKRYRKLQNAKRTEQMNTKNIFPIFFFNSVFLFNLSQVQHSYFKEGLFI